MKNKIKAIVFDVGGVITNKPTSLVHKKISKKFKVELKLLEKNYSILSKKLQKGIIKENEFWREFAKRCKIKKWGELKKNWINEFWKKVKINKNVFNLAKKLKRKKYRVCVLSNVNPFHKGYLTKKLKKSFDLVVFSCDVKSRKPEKRIYSILLKKLKLKPENCIIIDDEKENLKYPQKMGMKTIHFISFKQVKKELNSLLISSKRINN